MNVLAIGDLHQPFTLDKYLRFCKNVDRKESCNKVVFVGDVIDSHYSSYHETDPDGMSAGEELDMAIGGVRKWYMAFPEAIVLIGNHDRLVHRKAFTAGISSRWIRDYSDILGTKGWDFVERTVIDGVQYIHGEGGTARSKCKADMMSTVQGHLHTQCYTEWTVGANFKVFGCQVGCGVDHESYAMAYAKSGKKPAIGCATIRHGKTAINHMMDL
jgi:metallophosphoesterase superfamily enzyme